MNEFFRFYRENKIPGIDGIVFKMLTNSKTKNKARLPPPPPQWAVLLGVCEVKAHPVAALGLPGFCARGWCGAHTWPGALWFSLEFRPIGDGLDLCLQICYFLLLCFVKWQYLMPLAQLIDNLK